MGGFHGAEVLNMDKKKKMNRLILPLHCAEVCELVGFYILSKLRHILNYDGIYRSLDLDLHVNLCVCLCVFVCVCVCLWFRFFFKASDYSMCSLLTVVLAPYLSN